MYFEVTYYSWVSRWTKVLPHQFLISSCFSSIFVHTNTHTHTHENMHTHTRTHTHTHKHTHTHMLHELMRHPFHFDATSFSQVARWTKVGLHQLVMASDVKKIHRRAILVVHPGLFSPPAASPPRLLSNCVYLFFSFLVFRILGSFL